MTEKGEYDEVDVFKDRIRNFLIPNDMDWDVITDLKDPKREKMLEEHGWELVSVVAKAVGSGEGNSEFDVLRKAGHILEILALSGNPKEILLGLLEQMGAVEDVGLLGVAFRLYTSPLQTALMRMKTKNYRSLFEVLGTLCRRLKDLPVPRNYECSAKDLLMLDLDPDVRRIQEAVGEVQVFLGPFVEEMKAGKFLEEKRRLAGYVMKVLEDPMFHVDLSSGEGKVKGMLRSCAEYLVSYLKALEPNFFAFFERNAKNMNSKGETEENVSHKALATLFYLVLGEGICKDHLPCVFSTVRMTDISIPLITVLLTAKEECAVFKGLCLAEAILQGLPNGHLNIDNVQLNNYYEVVQGFVCVAIACPIDEQRKRAATLIRTLPLKFEDRTKFLLLKGLLMTNTHSGVLSLFITLVKDCVSCWINGNLIPAWFTEERQLDEVLKVALDLPEGVETDLLVRRDRIMSALNLLRFLFLGDEKSVNATGIWDRVDFIRDSFLKVVQRGLEISRAHYKLEVDNKLLEKKSGKKAGSVVSVSANGVEIPSLDPAKELSVLNSSITSFDLMESVVVRLSEVIDQRNK